MEQQKNEILISTEVCGNRLEEIKQEHETTKPNLDAFIGAEKSLIDGKSTIIDKSLVSSQLSVRESHVMITLAQRLQQQKEEMREMRDQIRQLSEAETLPSPANASTTSTSNGIPNRLIILQNLAIQYAASKRYEVAVPLCQQALNDLETNYGGGNPDVATMLNVLGLFYRDQKKYDEAEKFFIEALSIRQEVFGNFHLLVAVTLNNLAVLHAKRRNFKEAESLCQQALEIRQDVLGYDHPDVAKQLNNLALFCQNQGKYDESENYLLQSISIYAFGPNDPNVLAAKSYLSTAYLKQEKFDEAEVLLKEILSSAHEHAFGPLTETNEPIWKVAEDRETGKEQENADWQNIFKGENSQVVRTTMKNLGILYRRQQKIRAAEMLERAIKN